MRGTLFGGGPCRGGLFELNAPPPRHGVWAATTTIAMVRRMEWRHPLLYVNPCSHRVSATLKISQKCVKQQPKNEHAVHARCYVRCARCVCFPLGGRDPMFASNGACNCSLAKSASWALGVFSTGDILDKAV